MVICFFFFFCLIGMIVYQSSNLAVNQPVLSTERIKKCFFFGMCDVVNCADVQSFCSHNLAQTPFWPQYCLSPECVFFFITLKVYIRSWCVYGAWAAYVDFAMLSVNEFIDLWFQRHWHRMHCTTLGSLSHSNSFDRKSIWCVVYVSFIPFFVVVVNF